MTNLPHGHTETTVTRLRVLIAVELSELFFQRCSQHQMVANTVIPISMSHLYLRNVNVREIFRRSSSILMS